MLKCKKSPLVSKFTNFSDDLTVYFIKSSFMQSFPCTDENFQKFLNIAL